MAWPCVRTSEIHQHTYCPRLTAPLIRHEQHRLTNRAPNGAANPFQGGTTKNEIQLQPGRLAIGNTTAAATFELNKMLLGPAAKNALYSRIIT